MRDYKEEDYLELSGIQHYVFCKRQWALIHIEKQWAENVRTVQGELLHKRAHDESISEKHGDVIVTRAMPVFSRELGISGECDIVEFHRDQNGVFIQKWNDKFAVIPVEYKRGKPKSNDSDILQLTAQAICLEDMLCIKIEAGYLYYGEIHHRQKVTFTKELKDLVRKSFEEMHDLYERKYTPIVRRKKSCNACSLKNICLPVIMKKQNVEDYITGRIKEDC